MFQWSAFGKIKFDNAIYSHDLWIEPGGKPRERIPFGDHHIFTKKELEQCLEQGVKTVIFGTGAMGVATVEKEASDFAKEKGIKLIAVETPEAVKEYNGIKDKKTCAAVMHLTC